MTATSFLQRVPEARLSPAPLLTWLVVSFGRGEFSKLWKAYEIAAGEPEFRDYEPQRLSIIASRAFARDTLGRLTWEKLAFTWGTA